MRTLEAVVELKEFNLFPGQHLGILPFRDRWVGNSQTKTSNRAIQTMQAIAQEQEIRLWPGILESDKFRQALDTGTLPSDDLIYGINLIVQELESQCLIKISTPSIA